MEVVTFIASPFLSALFQSLFDMVRSRDLINYATERQVLDEIKKWERMLKKIYKVLDDAEERQTEDQLVKDWVSELKDLAYDVEDVLDEFATDVLRRKSAGKSQASSSKVRKFIPACFSGVNVKAIKFNNEMISGIEKISERLQEITDQKNQLQLKEDVRGKTRQVINRPPTTSLVNKADVYGRDKDLMAILQLLRGETSTGSNFRVIPIIGLGGIGKTTLAQLIFDDASLEFDLKAWVSVGEDFDVVKLTRTTLEYLDENCDSSNFGLLQTKLQHKLSGKKFLVILDDVWNEEYALWDEFSKPFKAGAAGSRVIVTTRHESVSLKMSGTAFAYPLQGLSYDDCLSVFSHHALGERNLDSHSYLKEVGEKIVKRCQGLPLAAKALGGVLRGKPNLNSWEQLLHDEKWDILAKGSGILPALWLSYYHLPSHLKRCFAYCAMFPKDYEFNKNRLVLLWRAEGLLQQSNKVKQIYDLGQEYFDELLSRSFFQPSIGNNKSAYVMHDLMNDLARFVSGKTWFHLDDKSEDIKLESDYEKIRHSSFIPQQYDIFQRFEVFSQLKNTLRTFLALLKYGHYGTHHLSVKVLDELLSQLQCLRVLSLPRYSIVELPASIVSLKHLRYLDLSHSWIKSLPEPFSDLINLQTLILQGCRKLIELPTGLCDLINLHYLDISGTVCLQKMPPHIGNLSNLHTLSKFIVGEGIGLKELSGLSHLHGELHITDLQNVVNSEDAKLANLKSKQGLSKLIFEWNDDFGGSRNENDEIQVLKSLLPHHNLEQLSVKFYGGSEFPSWIGDSSFNKMTFVELCGCPKISSLPSLGELPFLRELIIRGMNGVKEVGAEFNGNGSSFFPSLEILKIEDMLEWERWSWSNLPSEGAGGTFPKLRKLTLRNCPKLVGNLSSCLLSLRELSIERCQEALLRNVQEITSLTYLRISKISGLLCLPENLQYLVALEKLNINQCDELRYLWHDGTNLHKLDVLKTLCIYSCPQLVCLIEGEEELLPCNLHELRISSCSNLERLPIGLHSLTSLEELSIQFCKSLTSFPTTDFPCSLRRMEIRYCVALESPPDGVTIDVNCGNKESDLMELWIENCPSFTVSEIPSSVRKLTLDHGVIQFLESLNGRPCHITILKISGCHQLESFPANGLSFPTLFYLGIEDCPNLRTLSNHMNTLTSVRHLSIYNCNSLESLSESSLPPNLAVLYIRGCRNLSQPMSNWGLHKLTSLTHLTIYDVGLACTDMISFPASLLLPTSLKYVFIGQFPNLESISGGLQKLTSLRILKIWKCPKVQSLPQHFPTSLGCIQIIDCPLLEERISKDKGDLWRTVAHIPRISFNSEFCYIG